MIGALMKIAHSVDDIAALIDGHVEGDGAHRLTSIVGPDLADAAALVPVYRRSWLAEAARCGAGCLLVGLDAEVPRSYGGSVIRVADPDRALDALVSQLAPTHDWPSAGVHPSAVIAPTAELHESVHVGARVVVGPGARVGAGTVLHAGVIVGAGVVIGDLCRVHAGAILESGCELGARVVIQAGAILGGDGFGYRQVAGAHEKIPQLGAVELHDDVEIGSGTTIDRARFDATIVGAGTKIDSQVHIAHNCRIGKHCAIAGHTTLAGHAVIEDFVLVGGRSGIINGVTLAERSSVGGCSLVVKDTEPGQYVAGIPARPGRRWAREVAALAKLPEWMRAHGGER